MRIPLVQDPPLDEESLEAAISTLRSGMVTQGAKVRAFEEAFAESQGMPAAVYVNSGSSANLLAVTLLRLKPGDEVIVPAVTWPTVVWPIAQCGGIPVLVDVDPETLCMTEADLGHAIGPKTRAIFLVHTLGNVAGCLARASRIHLTSSCTLLEDCCEALDAKLNGNAVGTFGRMGTFSLYLSHHMTTIEGGMVLCQSPQDADRLRVLRAHGWTRNLSTEARQAREAQSPDVDPRFLFVGPGYNLRNTDVHAAIGLVQLGKREAWAMRRRQIARYWTESLNQNVFHPVRWADGAVPFAFPLVGLGRWPLEALKDHLTTAGIEHRPIVAGNLARQPGMTRILYRQAGPLPGAEMLHHRGLYMGLHAGLDDGQVDYLLTVLRAFRP